MDKKRGTPMSLAVDHSAATGVVRDLLCGACNTAFGLLQEKPEIIARMGLYAERWTDPASKAEELGRPPRHDPRQHDVIIETEWGPMTLSDAARRVGLKPRTVLNRRARGWPEDRLLLPLRRPARLSPLIIQQIDGQ